MERGQYRGGLRMSTFRPSLHRNNQPVEVRADDGADRFARERQQSAVLIGEYDRLRAPADCGAHVSRGINAGDIGRPADVAYRTVEPRLGGAEGEAVTEAADPERIASAVEGERARASRAADDEAGLDDAEADAARVGARRGSQGNTSQGQQRDQACTKGG
jgi:hypothetical protein